MVGDLERRIELWRWTEKIKIILSTAKLKHLTVEAEAAKLAKVSDFCL